MSNELLSQSDIDSLVSGISEKKQALPKAKMATPAGAVPQGIIQASEETSAIPAVKEVSLQDTASGERNRVPEVSPESLNSLNTQLAERLSRVETKLQRLEQSERVTAGAGTAQVSPQQLQEVVKYIQKLSLGIRDISIKLQGTLGYDIYHSFKCDKCGTQERVATVFKCTNCSHENWRGWWPKR